MTDGEISWSGLLVSARRWGALAWSEARLAEVLAAWTAEAEDPARVVELAAQARRHADRAVVVRERLPELRELPVAGMVVPGDADWVRALDAMAAEGPDRGLAAYGGRILPALAASYRLCADLASPVAEPSVRRHLGRLADEVDADRRRWGTPDPDPAAASIGPAAVLGTASGG